MPPAISATVFALFSIGCAFLTCRFLLFGSKIVPYFVCWAVMAPYIFLVGNPVVFLAFVVAVVGIASLMQRRYPAALFTAVMPAVPGSLGLIVPFPGINYLVTLMYPQVVTITTLTRPFLASFGARRIISQAATVDRLVLLFFTVVVFLNFRGLPITSGFRSLFYSVLMIILPYFAISRSVASKAAMIEVLKAFLVAALILCFIAFMSEVKRWNFYDFVLPSLKPYSSGIGGFMQQRGGLLRTGATVVPALLGFLLAVGIIVLEYIRGPLRIAANKARIAQAILLLGVIASTGRGGWFGGLVAGLAYGVLSTRNRALTVIAWAGSIFVAGFVIFALANHGNLYFLDPYGTFKYRVDLFFNSVDAIGNNPLLGSVNFLGDEALQASRQGQGIIDIVNTYLQVALQYGLVTLCIFVAMFGIAIHQLLRMARMLKRLKQHDETNACYLMASILLGYMAFIATISQVSVIENYEYVFLGLSTATIRLAGETIRQALVAQSAKAPKASSQVGALHPVRPFRTAP